MAKEPLICIIALTWNNKSLIKKCVSSIYKNTDYSNYKVIIVENGSTDDCVEFSKKAFPKTDVLHIISNRGFSGGNNVGVKYAMERHNPKYVLLISNDIEVVQKDWLSRMVNLMEANPNIGIQTCKLLYPDNTIQSAGTDMYKIIPLPDGHGEIDNGQHDSIKVQNAAIGALFLISSKVINKIGLMDEIFRPVLQEDMDYCVRTRRAGFSVVYNGFVKAIHHEGQTIGKMAQDNKYYISQRNTLLLASRFFPIPYQILRIAQGILFSMVWKKPIVKFSLQSLELHKNFLYRLTLFVKAFEWAMARRKLEPIYPKIE